MLSPAFQLTKAVDRRFSEQREDHHDGACRRSMCQHNGAVYPLPAGEQLALEVAPELRVDVVRGTPAAAQPRTRHARKARHPRTQPVRCVIRQRHAVDGVAWGDWACPEGRERCTKCEST